MAGSKWTEKWGLHIWRTPPIVSFLPNSTFLPRFPFSSESTKDTTIPPFWQESEKKITFFNWFPLTIHPHDGIDFFLNWQLWTQFSLKHFITFSILNLFLQSPTLKKPWHKTYYTMHLNFLWFDTHLVYIWLLVFQPFSDHMNYIRIWLNNIYSSKIVFSLDHAIKQL